MNFFFVFAWQQINKELDTEIWHVFKADFK
jgi:hypothetical protein